MDKQFIVTITNQHGKERTFVQSAEVFSEAWAAADRHQDRFGRFGERISGIREVKLPIVSRNEMIRNHIELGATTADAERTVDRQIATGKFAGMEVVA